MSMLDPFVPARHDYDLGRHARRILRTYPAYQHHVAEAKRQARRLSRRAARLLIHQELNTMRVELEMDLMELDKEILYLEKYVALLSA